MNYLYKVYQKLNFNKTTNAYEVEFWSVHRVNTHTLEIFSLSSFIGTTGNLDIWIPVYPTMLINLVEMTDFLSLEETIHFLEKTGQTKLSAKLMNHI
jgi:uncharacterized membrane protein